MTDIRNGYSVVQLNEKENGGALARVDGLAIRLTEDAALQVAAALNSRSEESGASSAAADDICANAGGDRGTVIL